MAVPRSRFGVSLPLLVALAALVTVLGSGPGLLGDPDTYWHIVAGRWIWAHHAAPHADIFSYSMAGAPWVAHEWLAEVIFAPLYDQWGWNGLVLATALSFAAALAILTRALLRFLEPAHALAGMATAWGMALPHLLARPHVLTLPILVLWFAALVEARSRGRAPSAWLALLMVLWANLHGGFALGLVFAALFAGEAVWSAPTYDHRIRAIKSWGGFLALSLAASLVTPNGLAGLWLPLHLLRMKFALSVLAEWQSPNFQDVQPLEVWLLLGLGLALGFGVKLPPTRIAMVLLLIHISLAHQRHAEILGLVAPLLLAQPIGELIRARRRRGKASSLDETFADLAGRASLPGVAASAVLALALGAVFLAHPIERKPDGFTPSAALAAARADHLLDAPVFNDYGFGGYLIFAGVKPFIDGRSDLYGDEFLQRYVEATRGVSGELPDMLDQYHAGWTLFAAKSTAATLMDHLPGWRRVYADDTAVVHARNAQP